MGLAPLKKATLLLYQEDREKFLRELQDMEIFHISDSRSSTLSEEYPELVPEEDIKDEKAEELLEKLQRVIDVLKQHSEGKGVLGQFIDIKEEISPEEWVRIINNIDVEEIEKIYSCDEKRYHLRNRLTELREKRDFYNDWLDMDLPISELDEIEEASAFVYRIKIDRERLPEKFKDKPIDFKIIFERDNTLGILFIVYDGYLDDFKELISEFEGEKINFRGEDRYPRKVVHDCQEEINKIEDELEEINNWIEEKGKEFKRFLITYDYFQTRFNRTDVLNKALVSEKVFFVEGWVDERDAEELKNLTERHSNVDLKWTQPREDERMPTKLENNKLAEPYEALTALYAYPRRGEVDPSPYMALFFGLFFAFCLTDAIYGIALVVAGFLLLRKIPEGRKYLWIFIVGGILTIFAGALTGGWFGSKVGQAFPVLGRMVEWLQQLRLFDPFEKPMLFFGLSLGFGVVQIFVGLGVAMKEKIRKKEFLSAFSNELSWFLFFILLGASLMTDRLKLGFEIPVYIAFIPLLIVILFSWRSNSWIKQILKGSFVLFRGMVGFMGDILSYSRIMALGLVTAGLGMSINILTMMVKDMIPLIGPLIAVIVFVGGHLFSLAINTLSSFVHTMRLQYAEFFSYFYEGGGEKFAPFGFKSSYVRIEKEKKEA